MFDDLFRKVKDDLFGPLARLLSGVHPNVITFSALMVALVAGTFAIYQFYVLATVLWLLSRALDALDGSVARFNNKQSDFGGYFDIVLDFVAYAFLPIAIVLGQPSESNYLSLIFLLASFYVNAASWMYLSSVLEKRAQGAQSRGEITSVTMTNGLVGGTETVVFYCLFLLLTPWLSYLFIIFGSMVIFTSLQRLVWAAKHL